MRETVAFCGADITRRANAHRPCRRPDCNLRIDRRAAIHRKRHPEEITAPNPQCPDSISIEEVSRILDAAQQAASEELDWRSGIVDLQKLLGRESSMNARRDLWKNFELVGEYVGSGEQNVALHRLLMEEIARGAIRFRNECTW